MRRKPCLHATALSSRGERQVVPCQPVLLRAKARSSGMHHQPSSGMLLLHCRTCPPARSRMPPWPWSRRPHLVPMTTAPFFQHPRASATRAHQGTTSPAAQQHAGHICIVDPWTAPACCVERDCCCRCTWLLAYVRAAMPHTRALLHARRRPDRCCTCKRLPAVPLIAVQFRLQCVAMPPHNARTQLHLQQRGTNSARSEAWGAKAWAGGKDDAVLMGGRTTS